MAVKRRPGGNSWFCFASNYKLKTPGSAWDLTGDPPNNPVLEIIDELLSDPANFPNVRRQFTSYDLDVEGNISRSEAVRGSVGQAKGQTDQIWGSGPIETELYMSGMADYVQLILNGDPNTKSTDTTEATLTAANAEIDLKAGTNEITLGKGGSPTLQVTPRKDRVPGKLEIEIADAGGKKVTVSGYRKTGWLEPYDAVPQTEVITLDSGTDKATTVKSYYLPYKDGAKTETFPLKLSIADAEAGTSKDIVIKSKPITKKTLFKSRNSVHPGATFFANVGGVPRLAWAAVPRRAIFRGSNPIRLTMEMLSRGLWRRRTVESGFAKEELNIPESWNARPFIENTFFPHYGRVLFFDDDADAVVFRDAEITIDQGLDFLEGSTGSKTRLPIERTPAGRTIAATINMYYESGNAATDDFIRWDERFRDNISTKVDLYTYSWDANGVERYHKITIAEAELTAVPRVPVPDKGNLNESLSLQGTEEGAAKDIEWEIVDDAGWTGPSLAHL